MLIEIQFHDEVLQKWKSQNPIDAMPKAMPQVRQVDHRHQVRNLDISDPGIDILGRRNVYLAGPEPKPFLLLNTHWPQSLCGRGSHAQDVAGGPAVQQKNHPWS